MSRWVHADGDPCWEASDEFDADGFAWSCGCRAPTPDPASPCGVEREDGSPCGYRASMGSHWVIDSLHSHQPTRCTCGHPIEERA